MQNPDSGTRRSNSGAIVTGVVLIMLGGFFLCATLATPLFDRWGIDLQLWKFWPVIFLIPGGAFFIPIILSLPRPERRRSASGFAIPGTVLLMLFLIFSYTTLTEDWEAWGYLWAAIPLSVGLGMYVMVLLGHRERGLFITASWLSGASLVFLTIFATFMSGGLLRFVGPLLLILVGIVVVVAVLLQGASGRDSRDSQE